jgi:hypothetical protein
VACDDPLMTRVAGSGACQCPTGYSLVGSPGSSRCLAAATVATLQSLYPPAQVSQITFPAVRSTDSSAASARTVFSPLLEARFYPAAVGCMGVLSTGTAASTDTAVRTACQAAVNLCTLALSDFSHPACRFLRTHTLSIAPIVWGFTDWRVSVPFAFYADPATALASADIDTTVALSGGNAADLSRQSRLSYRLQTFALNGTLVSSVLLSSELQLCPAVVSAGSASAGGDTAETVSTRFLSFGTAYEASCQLELAALAANSPSAAAGGPLFYELFFLDTDARWYPVPVLVKNLRDGSQTLNTDVGYSAPLDAARTRVLRRFHLTDAASTAALTPGAAPVLLTYARAVTLRVEMRSGSVQKVKPPVLTIEYASRLRADYEASGRALREGAASFAADYVAGAGDAATAAYVLFALMMVWVAVVWVVKIIVLANKERAGGMGLGAALTLCVRLLGIWGECAFWLVFAFATYFFIFFKGQDEVHVLMPLPSGSVFAKAFGPFLIVGTICCLLSVLSRVYRQATVDVLFIDWEAPAPQNALFAPVSSQSQAAGGLSSVSAWRKIFVANKWEALQAVRTVALAPTLCGLLFLLYGVGLEGLSTAQPDGTNLNTSAAPTDDILRFFVTAVIFLGLAGLQRAYRAVVTDCFAPRPTTQFLDLLASTNISCCVLDAKHHMYYLHGQSVHARADASMEELHRQLLRERRNWVQPRGLLDDEASFSVFLAPALRAHYDAEYGAVLHRHLQLWQQQGARASAAAADFGPGNSSVEMGQRATQPLNYRRGTGAGGLADLSMVVEDELVRAHTSLNRFLIDFINKNTPNHPWEYAPRSFVSRKLDMPPAAPPATTAVTGAPVGAAGMQNGLYPVQNTTLFAADPDHGFALAATLLGLEHHLVVLDVLLLTLFEWVFDTTLAGVLVAFVIDSAICWARLRWGRINTARKTMIDERFMV